MSEFHEDLDFSEASLAKAELIKADEAFKEAMLAAHPDLEVKVAGPDLESRPRRVSHSGYSGSLIGSCAALCIGK